MTERMLDVSRFEPIVALVRERTGLVFGPSRRQQVEAGIGEAIAAAGGKDPERFLQLLRADERIFQALVEKLVVSETYFFREREQFETLRSQVLTELQRSGADRQKLRFWSAGCATGEEPYSLAILAEREGLADSVSIMATDISQAALTAARAASYGAWSFRGNSGDLVDLYFQRRGDRLVLIERIRRLVEFARFNLASDVYPPWVAGSSGIDLILCRNVLIYFDPETVQRVAMQMFGALKDGGWLITGPSDPPLWDCAPFETVLTPGGVFYRRGRRAPHRRATVPISTLPAVSLQAQKPPRPAGSPAAVSRETSAPASVRRLPGTPSGVAPAQQAIDDCVAELQALANGSDPQRAASAAAAATEAHPLSPEIHYLQAIVQMSLGRYEDAASSLRRVLYLDRSMAVAHFTLGSVLQRCGAAAEARRSFRNVIAIGGSHRADEIVPFSEGEQMGRLIEAARAQLAHDRVRTEASA